MLALTIFLPTLNGIPQSVYLLCLLIVVFRCNRIELSQWRRGKTSFSIILLIIVLGCVNNFTGADRIGDAWDIIPFFLLHSLTFIIALCLNKKDLELIVLCVAAEAIFVMAEFAMGVNTVFASHPEFRQVSGLEYLYFLRPMGLSSSTSTMAFKLFCALIMIDYIGRKNVGWKIVRIILIIAVIINFNRTSMVAIACYYAAKFVIDKDNSPKFKHRLLAVLVLTAVFLALGGIDIVLDQFFRGRGTVDLSYRDVLWKQNFEFISKNLLFGNHSFKYLTLLDEYGFYEHAHNSFIEMLSTHGLFIFLLYVLLIAVNVKRRNALLVMPFIVLSLFQYGIFWGVSFLDIIFFKFLIFGTDEKDYDWPEEL